MTGPGKAEASSTRATAGPSIGRPAEMLRRLGTAGQGGTGITLPDSGDWEDVLGGARHAGGGRRVRAAELFAAFPVAVLLRR
jgi:maltooligosyltrehalose synthase